MMTPDTINNDFSELLLEVGLTLPSHPQVQAQVPQSQQWVTDDYACRSVVLSEPSVVKATVDYTLSAEESSPYDDPGDTLQVQMVMTFKSQGEQWILADSEIVKTVVMSSLG